jgi:hypothetical protein
MKPFEYIDLVANGKVPFFNKNEEKWVDKATVSEEDIAAAEARKILEGRGTNAQTAKTEEKTEDINTSPQLEDEAEGDDLPF